MKILIIPALIIMLPFSILGILYEIIEIGFLAGKGCSNEFLSKFKVDNEIKQ